MTDANPGNANQQMAASGGQSNRHRHQGQYTKEVRRTPNGNIGIAFGQTEYEMSLQEAMALIDLITAVRLSPY